MEQASTSGDLELIATLVVINATMTMSLALSTITRQLGLINGTSRKRRRDRDTEWKHVWFMINAFRSISLRIREIQCKWYIKPRTIQWFYLYIDFAPYDDPVRFKDFFHVNPMTFYVICEMVNDEMLTNPPMPFCTLPNRRLTVERQVALALRRLCTGDQYLEIGELFGVSCSTVVKVTWKFIQAMNKKGRRLIKWPTGSELEEVKKGFFDRWGFPNCCGAIDGTHFPIELPAAKRIQDYYDYKKKTSVSMQEIVDMKLRFLDIVACWPGSIHDTRLLRVSTFFRDVEYRRVKLNSLECHCQDGASVLREYIIGDAEYPLYPWLIVPFMRGVSDEHDCWNHSHSQARMVVERALGQLKGAWRILSRILWKPRRDRIGPLIYCCCLLHNLLIEREDNINPILLHGITAHPGGYSGVQVPRRECMEGGVEARENLLKEVWTKRNMRDPDQISPPHTPGTPSPNCDFFSTSLDFSSQEVGSQLTEGATNDVADMNKGDASDVLMNDGANDASKSEDAANYEGATNGFPLRMNEGVACGPPMNEGGINPEEQ